MFASLPPIFLFIFSYILDYPPGIISFSEKQALEFLIVGAPLLLLAQFYVGLTENAFLTLILQR